MKRAGFTLIEIVISITLSSIVSLVLYNMLNQSTKVVDNVNSFINLDNKTAILYNQLDRTISGAFCPITELPKSNISTSTLVSTGTATNITQPKPDLNPEQKPQEKKKLEKIFYSENSGENLKILTLISTGALRAYGETGPKITRVVYRLVKDEQHNGFYKLLIQQNSKYLDLDILKPENSKTRSYELATGIKSFKATYWARENQQNPQENSDKKNINKNIITEPVQEKINYIKLSEWGSKEMLEKYKQQIPEYIEFKIEIWDDNLKRSKILNLKFKVYAYKKYSENKKS